MANIRIKDLSTTASTTASDDFFGVDGATNGTRKLNAYSPTFGGNLTVSGGGVDGTYGTVLYLVPSGFSTYRHTISTSASSTGPTFNLLKFSLANGASTTTDVLTLIGNGNATLAGNLTVSGGTITGGTSGLSLAAGGTNQNIAITPSGAGSVLLGASGGNISAASGVGSYTFSDAFGYGMSVSGAGLVLGTVGVGQILFKTGAGVEAARILSNQNFLLGTTTDGGQKLQVNGTAYISSTTTIAGDVSINRGASDTYFSLVTSGTTAGQYILFEDSGGASGSIAYTHSTNALAFKTNGTIGLTLDSSQNATFAGNVTINKAAPDFTLTRSANTNSGLIQLTTSATYDFAIGLRNTTDSDLHIYNYGTSNDALKIARSDSLATFGGAVRTAAPSGGTAANWKLGTVATVSPTSPNRTIEVDIGGTIYYIHAKTTNN